ncbi:hypothetical protein BKA65DRAFT_509904 [Rhexocercosporidium sp. MPI-PUGE-AT-0058]|nr:hypothetical protein BKA65DRAFT_509904 [Rhexocercosporidium sp. MPI-PUGE-AT-0058]
MATSAPPNSPMFSFFHMDMQSIADGGGDRLPPTTTMPIADKDLVFVHLNEVTGPTQDTNTRHKVRAHVMRDFQRKKHMGAKPSKSNRRSLLPYHHDGLESSRTQLVPETYSEESSERQMKASEETMSVVPLPDPPFIGLLEPFNALPISGSPRLQLLVHHYNSYLVNTLIPVNPKDKWFNFALSDPALFYATMMHAAMHQRLVNGGLDQGEQAQLKRDTIMMVNQRLEDPVLSLSDVTIGAVVCLVLLENQERNITLSNIHMNGLQKMIALRGGIDNLGLAGVLRRKILWGDLLNATISGDEPRFHMTPTAAHPTPLFAKFTTVDRVTVSQHASGQIYVPTGEACSCSTQFSTILNSLRSLSSQSNLEADLTGTLSDSIYLAERHLFYLFKNANEFPTWHSPTCSSLGPECFIAAQIYLYYTLRSFPFEVPVIQMFLERLKDRLWDSTSGEVSVVWEGKEQMLLWVLSLGALASVGNEVTRIKFVKEMQRVCETLGVGGLGGFTAQLKGVVWREPERDLKLVALWNEVHGGISFESLELGKLELGEDFGIGMQSEMEIEFGF